MKAPRLPLWLTQVTLSVALTWNAQAVLAFELTPPPQDFATLHLIAQQQHQQILGQYGAVSTPKGLSGYVTDVGQTMVRASDMPTAPFEFTILDSPVVNAFTTGGGYIYVTRGALAALNTQSELSAMLAHEVAHVTLGHTDLRAAQAMQDSAARTRRGVLTGRLADALSGGILATARQQAYSRRQEHEADETGQRILVSAGLDALAMPAMLTSVLRASAPDTPDQGQPQQDPAWLRNHPDTAQRIADTTDFATSLPAPTSPPKPDQDRTVYLTAINRLEFGPDPSAGVFRGGMFLHPDLGITLTFPDQYQIENLGGVLMGTRDADHVVMFTGGSWPQDKPLEDYALSGWHTTTDGQTDDLDRHEVLTINTMPAVLVVKQTRSGVFDRLGTVATIAYRAGPDIAYSLSFMAQGRLTPEELTEFRSIAESFRKLTPAEVAAVVQLKIDTVTVQTGDTFDSLMAQTPDRDAAVKQARALNGFDGAPKVGQMIKILVPVAP